MGKKGIALLVAVFVSGLVLAIAMGIFGLLFGGSRFAFTSQESFSAFHAADSGLECAMYWDLRFNSFATSTFNGNTITCAGNIISDTDPNRTSSCQNSAKNNITCGGWESCTNRLTTNWSACNFDGEDKDGFQYFTIDFSRQDPANRSCAHVTVMKIGSKTVMQSLGENVCGAPAESSIQRGIQIDYRTF